MRCAPVRGWSEWSGCPRFRAHMRRRTATTGSYAFFVHREFPPPPPPTDGLTEVEERRYSRAAEGRCSLARSLARVTLTGLFHLFLLLLLPFLFFFILYSPRRSVDSGAISSFHCERAASAKREGLSRRRGGRRNLARSRLTPFFLSPQRSPRRKC